MRTPQKELVDQGQQQTLQPKPELILHILSFHTTCHIHKMCEVNTVQKEGGNAVNNQRTG